MNAVVGPSKRAETVAVEVLQKILGSSGIVTHTGDSHGADFHIQYPTGTSGLGEVKLDMDPNRRAAWVALTDRQRSQCVNLPANSGTWVVSTKPDPNVRLLDRRLPEIITEMIDRKLYEIDEYTWPRTPVFKACELAGVKRINRTHQTGSDEAVIIPQGWAGAVPLDSNSAIPWIESFFTANHKYKNSWNRLERAPETEKHVFIWISDGSPSDLQMRISFHPESGPTVAPVIPTWLTHLWIGISGTFAPKPYVWLFQPDSLWQTFEYE